MQSNNYFIEIFITFRFLPHIFYFVTFLMKNKHIFICEKTAETRGKGTKWEEKHITTVWNSSVTVHQNHLGSLFLNQSDREAIYTILT